MKITLYERKREREKEMVFQGIMSRNWLSGLKKCAADGTFHPHRRVKKEGKRQVEEGRKWAFLEYY